MKLWIKILSVFLFFSLIFLPKNIEAQRGCCSHHDGVCGCSGGRQLCCDDTLSPSCTCSSPQPTSTPRPTAIPTKKPTLIPTKIPTNIPTHTSTPTEEPTLIPNIEQTKTEEISPTLIPQPQILGETDTKNSTEPPKTSDFIIFFSVLGLIGFGIYKLFIKIKNKVKELFNKK